MDTQAIQLNNEYEQAIEDLRALPVIGHNPFMRLAQPQSSLVANNECQAGEWHIEGMDSSVIPNPLIVTPNRVRFVRKLWNEGLIECSSSDGYEGVGNPGGSCSECNLKDWVDGNRPICVAGLEFAFFVHELGITVLTEFKGSALKTANLLTNNWKNQASKGNIEPRFELSVVKRSGPNGSTYFTPIAKLIA